MAAGFDLFAGKFQCDHLQRRDAAKPYEHSDYLQQPSTIMTTMMMMMMMMIVVAGQMLVQHLEERDVDEGPRSESLQYRRRQGRTDATALALHRGHRQPDGDAERRGEGQEGDAEQHVPRGG